MTDDEESWEYPPRIVPWTGEPDTTDPDDHDVVAFGPPNRVVRVMGQRVGIRVGKPLIVDDDEPAEASR